MTRTAHGGEAPALAKQLIAAREERKDAFKDAQLLRNRIALLKAEEAKAWKKIQQTKKRAEEIVIHREEQEKHSIMVKKMQAGTFVLAKVDLAGRTDLSFQRKNTLSTCKS